MKLINLILIIILPVLLFFSSCDSTEPNDEQPPKPPGYQEDIPWPSLADSPWPMHHGNPQSNGRSRFSGPQFGKIEWELDSVYIKSGVSVGPDSTIYFIATVNPRGLYAINFNGTIKWKLEDVITNSEIETTPLIAADGTIYIGGGLSGKLYAIAPNGTIKWEFKSNGAISHVGMNIGLDGTIYFISYDFRASSISTFLYAVDKEGFAKWTLSNDSFSGRNSICISFSPDGRTLYIPGLNPSLFAVDIDNQAVKWWFGESILPAPPIVDSEGHIYLHSKVDSINSGKPSLYSLNLDGSIRWYYTHNNPKFNPFHYLEGAIDKYGNIYFAFDSLYSLDFEGNIRWKLDLGGYSGGSIVCDIDGVVYLHVDSKHEFLAVNSEGQVLWNIPMPEQLSGYSPAFGYGSRLYVPTFKSDYIYSIY